VQYGYAKKKTGSFQSSWQSSSFLGYGIFSQLSINVRRTACGGLTIERYIFMKNSTKSFALAAAFAGLLGGTAVRVNAQTTQPTNSTASAGVLVAQATPDTTKHACKGKNDCKGQGGGDAKHAGKNDCKGKGACATDGSKKS
jgi:hypothetical protein